VNPTLHFYTLAVISLFAGLYSWRAIKKLDEVAERLFGAPAAGAPQDLWAPGLAGALRDAARSPAQLAEALGQATDRVEAWLLAEERVPAAMQERIARELGVPAQALFGAERPARPRALLAREEALRQALTRQTGAGDDPGKTEEEREAVRRQALAAQLGESVERVAGWLEGNRPVDPVSRHLIAAWLGRAESELFREEAPDAAGSTAG
jgi:transcriptional regulator with XRE-family HTH domain